MSLHGSFNLNLGGIWLITFNILSCSIQITCYPFYIISSLIISLFTVVCRVSNNVGNYSCLVAEFHLYRLLGFHLVQSYLPTILMVVISWVSFWMDVNSVPGRVTLGITTLLTVSSKATSKWRLHVLLHVKFLSFTKAQIFSTLVSTL